MDAWAVLGVAPGSSERAIREAYLRLSRVRHPDVGGSDEAMRELNAAYDLLTSPSATPTPNWSREGPESTTFRDQFEAEPGFEPDRGPEPQVRHVAKGPKKPKKPFLKRRWPYALVGVLVVFLLTSGATDDPSPREKPAIYGLIGRCVELVDREIVDIVPCMGPHDAWVVDVIERPGQCPPLANNFLDEISHIICLNTAK